MFTHDASRLSKVCRSADRKHRSKCPSDELFAGMIEFGLSIRPGEIMTVTTPAWSAFVFDTRDGPSARSENYRSEAPWPWLSGGIG